MLHGSEEGLRNRRWNIFGARRFGAPFHIRLWKLGGVLGKEIGSHPQQAARLLPGCHDHRCLVAERGEEIAERMTEPRRRVQIDESRTPGRLRIAVRHADDAGFLQTEHVVDVVGPVAEEGKLGRAGIAENAIDAKRAKHTEGRFPNRENFRIHEWTSWWASLAAQSEGIVLRLRLDGDPAQIGELGDAGLAAEAAVA